MSAIPAIRFEGYTDPWEQRKLGELCQIGDIDHRMPDSVADGIPYVMTGDFVGINGIDYDKAKKVSIADYQQLSEKIRPEYEDIIFARYASIGAARLVKTHRRFLASYSCAILKTGRLGIGEYVYSVLQSPSAQQRLELSINIGSQGNVGIDSLNTLQIPWPTEAERLQIGAFFQQLDNLITLHQRKHDRLVVLKKALLDKMFPHDGSRFPELRFDGFTDPWEQRKLGDVATFDKGVGYSKSDISDEGDPLIHYGRLYTKHEIAVTEVDTFATPIENALYSIGGEVITPASGETAEDIAIASAIVSPGIMLGGGLNIVRPSAVLNPVFVSLSISYGEQHEELAKRAQGKSVVHLYNDDLRESTIVFPSLKEQNCISDLFLSLDNLITLHQRKLELLRNLKSACLDKMFV